MEIKKRSQEIYSGDYWDERKSKESLESNYTDKISQYKRKHWLSQIEYCKLYLQEKKDLLEIGSGAGQALKYFEENGFNVTGIEPDSRNVEHINQKLEHGGHCIAGFIEEMTIDGTFDVIWISHVFEHLIRPDILLEKCKSNLRKNGFIFIEVPECENYKMRNISMYENPSTCHFTKNTLSSIAKNSGYKIMKCDSLRIANLFESIIMKIFGRLFRVVKFYPMVITQKDNGWIIRLILKKP